MAIGALIGDRAPLPVSMSISVNFLTRISFFLLDFAERIRPRPVLRCEHYLQRAEAEVDARGGDNDQRG